MFPLCSIRNWLCCFFFLPQLKTINCYSSSNLKLPQVGVGYCLLTLTIAPHETLTEADKSISHPLIALLVALLGLTAEVPGFSQRPNNTSMLQHLHFIPSSFIFHCWCCERLVEKQRWKHACLLHTCVTNTQTHIHAQTHPPAVDRGGQCAADGLVNSSVNH